MTNKFWRVGHGNLSIHHLKMGDVVEISDTNRIVSVNGKITNDDTQWWLGSIAENGWVEIPNPYTNSFKYGDRVKLTGLAAYGFSGASLQYMTVGKEYTVEVVGTYDWGQGKVATIALKELSVGYIPECLFTPANPIEKDKRNGLKVGNIVTQFQNIEGTTSFSKFKEGWIGEIAYFTTSSSFTTDWVYFEDGGACSAINFRIATEEEKKAYNAGYSSLKEYMDKQKALKTSKHGYIIGTQVKMIHAGGITSHPVLKGDRGCKTGETGVIVDVFGIYAQVKMDSDGKMCIRTEVNIEPCRESVKPQKSEKTEESMTVTENVDKYIQQPITISSPPKHRITIV